MDHEAHVRDLKESISVMHAEPPCWVPSKHLVSSGCICRRRDCKLSRFWPDLLSKPLSSPGTLALQKICAPRAGSLAHGASMARLGQRERGVPLTLRFCFLPATCTCICSFASLSPDVCITETGMTPYTRAAVGMKLQEREGSYYSIQHTVGSQHVFISCFLCSLCNSALWEKFGLPRGLLETMKALRLKITRAGVGLCAHSRILSKYGGYFTSAKPLHDGGGERSYQNGLTIFNKEAPPSLALTRARAFKGFLKLD